MTDPAVEAAQRVWRPDWSFIDAEGKLTDAAREMAKPIREQMAVIRRRYSELEDLMLAADTSALMSRYANEMAGIKYAYDLLAPLIFTSEELERA